MNLRSCFAAVVVAALAVTAPAGEPVTAPAGDPVTAPVGDPVTATPPVTELSEFQLDVDKLGDLGTEVFLIAANAASDQGTLTFDSKLTLRTKVRDGKVQLADTWKIMGRTCHMTMTCQPDSILSLEEASVDMAARGQNASGKVVVGAGAATGEIAGRQVTFSYPDGTVNLAAIMRIVTQLPAVKGTTFTFSTYSEAIELRAQEPAAEQTFSITCQGHETITVDDETVQCTKFTLNVPKPVDFFVNTTSQRLQQVVADKGQTVMVRQDDAVTATAEAASEHVTNE